VLYAQAMPAHGCTHAPALRYLLTGAPVGFTAVLLGVVLAGMGFAAGTGDGFAETATLDLSAALFTAFCVGATGTRLFWVARLTVAGCPGTATARDAVPAPTTAPRPACAGIPGAAIAGALAPPT